MCKATSAGGSREHHDRGFAQLHQPWKSILAGGGAFIFRQGFRAYLRLSRSHPGVCRRQTFLDNCKKLRIHNLLSKVSFIAGARVSTKQRNPAGLQGSSTQSLCKGLGIIGSNMPAGDPVLNRFHETPEGCDHGPPREAHRLNRNPPKGFRKSRWNDHQVAPLIPFRGFTSKWFKEYAIIATAPFNQRMKALLELNVRSKEPPTIGTSSAILILGGRLLHASISKSWPFQEFMRPSISMRRRRSWLYRGDFKTGWPIVAVVKNV